MLPMTQARRSRSAIGGSRSQPQTIRSPQPWSGRNRSHGQRPLRPAIRQNGSRLGHADGRWRASSKAQSIGNPAYSPRRFSPCRQQLASKGQRRSRPGQRSPSCNEDGARAASPAGAASCAADASSEHRIDRALHPEPACCVADQRGGLRRNCRRLGQAWVQVMQSAVAVIAEVGGMSAQRTAALASPSPSARPPMKQALLQLPLQVRRSARSSRIESGE